MRLADRVVSASEREEMLMAIADDPQAQALLAQFEATGHQLAGPFAFIANAPVPQHLVDLVMNAPAAEPKRAPRESQRAAAAREWLLGWLTPPRLSALAASALAVSVGIGVLLDRGSTSIAAGPFKIVQGRAEADGLLKRALETAVSGEVVTPRAGQETALGAEPQLTFKSRKGIYCRQYMLEEAGPASFGGIACREPGGTWVIEDHRQLPRNKSVLANDPRSVFVPKIDSMISGITFGVEEEREIVKRRWTD